jgi:uncharacterized protein
MANTETETSAKTATQCASSDAVIAVLRERAHELQRRGMASLYLYGSFAAGSADEDSDIDLFFDRDPTLDMGLIELASLKIDLEALFARTVDLGTRTSLHPKLRARIENSAVRVF